MVLGTASDAGKSVIATALCRILARRGHRVAPFKAQNMSLNSAATPDGREIGRAQALQAEAAGVPATSDMNPVLLKPMSEAGAQAVVDGEIWGTVHARDYAGATKRHLWPHVSAAYDRLAERFDWIVIEGAGSPAEINLREHDIVNMSVAHYAEARAVLLADIDRGGAFAAVAGTFALLDEHDRSRISGYAFNKFRGDQSLLAPGIVTLSELVAVPCLGVIPYLDVRGLDEEDGVSLERRAARSRPWNERVALRVAIVAFPHLSNFTDFDALEEEPQVELRYVTSPQLLADADVVILPGTKNTIGDLRWLRERGLDEATVGAHARGAIVIGVCGGMQMLGRRIDDPHSVEEGGSAIGLSLLPAHSVFAQRKTTVPVRGNTRAFGAEVEMSGYEIHVGETHYAPGSAGFSVLERAGAPKTHRDGAIAERCIGTYVHGLFDVDAVRHAFLRWALHARSIADSGLFADVAASRRGRIDALADAVEGTLDLAALVAH